MFDLGDNCGYTLKNYFQFLLEIQDGGYATYLDMG